MILGFWLEQRGEFTKLKKIGGESFGGVGRKGLSLMLGEWETSGSCLSCQHRRNLPTAQRDCCMHLQRICSATRHLCWEVAI